MIVTNPLPGKGSVLVHRKTETTGTVLDPLAQEGATIILPFPVLSWEQRVNLFGDTDPRNLNPKTHNPECKEVQIPWLAPYSVTTEYVVLDQITYRADNLVRTISKIDDPILIQRSVSKFQNEIINRISGKHGLLARHIWGVRVHNSARFVVASGADIPNDYVGIPRKIAQKIQVGEGKLVLLNRAPTLWQGSVLVMKARIIPGNAGRLNPLCLRSLGADHDGDSVFVCKYPNNLLKPDKIGPEEPQLPLPLEQKWDHTLGLVDLFEKSSFLEEYAKVKHLPEDMHKYVRGMTIKEFTSETEEVTRDLARMKLEIGMISGTADKICALVDKSLLPIALRAKERLVQALLDSKHGTDCLKGADVCEAFEFGTPIDMQAVLTKAGISVEHSNEIITNLAKIGAPPISAAFQQHCPEMSVVKGSTHRIDQLRTVQKYVEAACVGTKG